MEDHEREEAGCAESISRILAVEVADVDHQSHDTRNTPTAARQCTSPTVEGGESLHQSDPEHCRNSHFSFHVEL
jgi:hypothetical protein